METTTNYLPLLICISLIVIVASLIYMYFVKKANSNEKKKEEVKINETNHHRHHGQQQYLEPELESEPEQEQQENSAEVYTAGTFRIKPKHTINEDEDDDGETVVENFHAPKTREGNTRPSMGDENVLHSRNSNPLSFIDKLQKRFDSNS